MSWLYHVVLWAAVMVPVNLRVVTYQGRRCAVPGTELEQRIIVREGRRVALGDCWSISRGHGQNVTLPNCASVDAVRATGQVVRIRRLGGPGVSGYVVVPVCNGSEETPIRLEDIPSYPEMDLAQFWNLTQNITGPEDPQLEVEDSNKGNVSDWEEMKALVVPQARLETTRLDVGTNESDQVCWEEGSGIGPAVPGFMFEGGSYQKITMDDAAGWFADDPGLGEWDLEDEEDFEDWGFGEEMEEERLDYHMVQDAPNKRAKARLVPVEAAC